MWLTKALQSVLQFDLIGLPLPAEKEIVNDFHMQRMINGDRGYCFCCPDHTFMSAWGHVEVPRSLVCCFVLIHKHNS